MNRRLILIVVSLLIAMMGCRDTTHSPVSPETSKPMMDETSGAFVTGSGHITDPRTGGWRTFSLVARTNEAGEVSGMFRLRIHLGPDGGAKNHGTVDCMCVEGNEAWVAGTLTKALNPDNIGMMVGFRVIDNGEGFGATPDQITLTRRWITAEEYCRDKLTDQPLNDVEGGNIQIHP